MKIKAVDIFSYDLAYHHGSYALSKGRAQAVQHSLVVRISTDEGLTGWGETCPLGRTHLNAYFESEREALLLLGQAIIGIDPRELGLVQAVMARTLVSGMAAKCAIDIACWDILGKATGLSVSTLLGGRQQETVPVWESIPLLDPDAIPAYVTGPLAQGVTIFQIKVGNDPHQDARRIAAIMACVGDGVTVIADANGGWNIQNALIAAKLLAPYPIFLEQPCLSIHNCAEVRRRSDLPMIVDESIGGMEDLIFARTHAGAGGVNIKPSRLGGLTPARLLRDTAAELGMMVTIDDSWGGALTSVALNHLAISTKPDALLATTFFTELTLPLIADAPMRGADGRGSAPTGPGLGCTVDEALLGTPLFRIA